MVGDQRFGVLAPGCAVRSLSGGTQAGCDPVRGEVCQLPCGLDAPLAEGLSEPVRQAESDEW